MKAWLLTIVAILIVLLQISFIPALRPLGVVPNIALVMIALVGLYGTASLALVLAISGGLALDLVSGANFGLYVGLFMVVALAAGYIHRAGLNWSGYVMALGLVSVATLVQNLVILGGLVRVANGWPVGHLLFQMGLEIILNCFAVLGLRPLIRWLMPADQSGLMVSGL